LEPSEALSTAAQIAVALAGFAGVVVVFRRESVHEWSPLDKFRLRLLLMNSVLPLALCMLGLLFLTIKPLPVGIWKWCSGFAFVVLVLFAVTSTKIFRRLDSSQVVQSYGRATHFMFYLLGILGTAMAILQVYNAAVLGVFSVFSEELTAPNCPAESITTAIASAFTGVTPRMPEIKVFWLYREAV
jgi:hypothetical protein